MLIPTILHAYFFEDKISEQTGETVAEGTNNVIFQDGNQIIFQDGNRMVAGTEVSGGSFEAETTAYMNSISVPNDSTVYYPGTAQETTGSTLWSAVDALIVQLKAVGVYSKLQYLRPRIGGTAAAHAINALNPAQFEGTYFGGWVHDGMGSKGNATNTHMATGFNPSIEQVSGNSGFTLSMLSNNTSDTIGGSGLLGAYTADGDNIGFLVYDANKVIVRLNAGFTLSPVMANRLGVYTISRVASATNHRTSKNGAFLFQGSGSGTNPNLEVYEGWVNSAFARPDVYLGTTAAHEGLTDTEAIDLQNAIITFETALNRKTW